MNKVIPLSSCDMAACDQQEILDPSTQCPSGASAILGSQPKHLKPFLGGFRILARPLESRGVEAGTLHYPDRGVPGIAGPGCNGDSIARFLVQLFRVKGKPQTMNGTSDSWNLPNEMLVYQNSEGLPLQTSDRSWGKLLAYLMTALLYQHSPKMQRGHHEI